MAWLQLSHRPLRLLAAIAGVSFANVLVFFQIGLSGSLYDSQKRPIDQISGQLVLVPKRYANLGEPLDFSRAQLVRVRGVQDVAGVTPLYIGKADWLNRDTRQSKQALVFGLTPENPALKLPILQQNKALLKQPNTLFFDSASKKAAGSVVQTLATVNTYLTELRGQHAKVVGIFKLGLTFAADINLIMSAANFQTYFPEKSNDDIQLGVIQLSAGANEALVQATISRFLDPSLQVLTIQQLKEREMSH